MGRHASIGVVLGTLVLACGRDAQDEGREFGSTRQKLAMFDYSASDTNAATNLNTATFPIDLAANETVMIGTCGLNESGPEPAGSSTNVIRLKSPDGTEVTSWGTHSPGRGCYSFSRVAYTAPSAGTYSIWAGCASSSSCSGTVSISKRKALAPYGASNTNNASLNTYNKQYYFNGGEVIRVSTCANSSFGASVGSGDTYLRLFKQSGGIYSEVASSNDAGGCGTASELVYNVPTAGYYQVRAGCSGNTSCSATFAVYSE